MVFDLCLAELVLFCVLLSGVVLCCVVIVFHWLFGFVVLCRALLCCVASGCVV